MPTEQVVKNIVCNLTLVFFFFLGGGGDIVVGNE